jgi:LPS export ABC transporter protein LptC
MRWQKRARLGVAVFGIACAIVVYAAIGERQTATQLPPPERLDPAATIESVGARVQQERGTERDFDIRSEKQLFYENGSSRLFGVEVNVRGREGRDFTLTAKEAQAGENRKELQLAGAVVLRASDGFELRTGQASFNQDDGIVRAPGEVAFQKGRMNGGGVGMTYDQRNDVLSLAERARVTLADDAGATTMEFSAGAGTLNRVEDFLELRGDVQARRAEQTFAGDTAVARLTPDENAVIFIELRGRSRVAGGGTALDSMSARDIDLDYTDDGAVLERVALVGDAALALSGRDGAPGRQMVGNTLDVTLAPDGAVTHVAGRDNVQLLMPATDGAPARTVAARALDATGEPVAGLTAAVFTENGQFREEARRGAAPRVARATGLRVALEDDSIGEAVFTGAVRFDEQGLQASAAEARYDPAAGTLRLTGADRGGPPRVADERITIEAQQRIDVTLEGRSMRAEGTVKTTLRARADARMPGLLANEQPVNVNADELAYEGAANRAVYTGNAQLWQGDATAIRGNTVTIDQSSGDLTVVGLARADILLEGGRLIGRAAEIRYEDMARLIRYLSDIPPPVTGRGAVPAPAPAAPPAGRGVPVLPVAPPPMQAQLTGPQGNLRADRIEVVLARAGSRAERLEAFTNVNVRVDTRVATGARLTYFAADERYVMTGANAVPVLVNDGCRQSKGHTLTFFKTADRIIIDGNEQIRTQTQTGGPCPAAPAAAVR